MNLKKKIILLLVLLLPIITFSSEVTTPLNSDITTIPELIKIILKTILDFAIPITVLAFIYVGFLFIKAQGNEKEISEAKNALIYVIIGTIILIGANAMYEIFFTIYNTSNL